MPSRCSRVRRSRTASTTLTRYEEPKMRWARTAYFQPLMMVRYCRYWLLVVLVVVF